MVGCVSDGSDGGGNVGTIRTTQREDLRGRHEMATEKKRGADDTNSNPGTLHSKLTNSPGAWLGAMLLKQTKTCPLSREQMQQVGACMAVHAASILVGHGYTREEAEREATEFIREFTRAYEQRAAAG